ncbi:hypothetical protein C8Q72DRAFT_573261 [Fomitopsis betulina]|nr:hypothetical protein C8Q72DRAFT_573261 [Fomitopsis betulina]
MLLALYSTRRRAGQRPPSKKTSLPSAHVYVHNDNDGISPSRVIPSLSRPVEEGQSTASGQHQQHSHHRISQATRKPSVDRGFVYGRRFYQSKFGEDLFHYDWSVLLICTAVCRAWHAHAQKYLPEGCKHAIALSSRAEVLLLSRCARTRVLHTKAVQVHGDGGGSLAHLGTFAAMLSGQLPHLNELHIGHGTWRQDTLHARILFRCLSTFIGLRHLTLRNIHFPTTMELAGILAALPNLCFLECVNISTNNTAYGRMSRMHPCPPHPLVYLLLDRVNGPDMHVLFRTMNLQSDVVEVVIPNPDVSDFTGYIRDADVKLAMRRLRRPSSGRLILTIDDNLAAYDLLMLHGGAALRCECQ